MTILTVFNKILSRSAQWRSCFALTFSCEREADLNVNKVCDFVMNEKNSTFISCVLNGLKYIWPLFSNISFQMILKLGIRDSMLYTKCI